MQEAQAISEAVLDAEVRIGQLMAEVPKATSQNNISGKKKINTQNDIAVDLGKKERLEKPSEVITPNAQKTKSEIIKESGFTPKQVQRFQALPLTGAIF